MQHVALSIEHFQAGDSSLDNKFCNKLLALSCTYRQCSSVYIDDVVCLGFNDRSPAVNGYEGVLDPPYMKQVGAFPLMLKDFARFPR